MIIGIDLGTTNSLGAIMTPDGPRVIPNALGQPLTPSMVGIDQDGNVLVGSAARELGVVHPDRCASVFKRHMGSEWSAKLGERDFNAVELSSLVLKSIKADAEAWVGEEVAEAVITVPAYFNEPQRKATMQAGQIAGLNVRRIINEPTAAAITYGLQDIDEERIALVFDLGGGTFDVSVVDQFDGALEIRSSAGETFLGGEDFTQAILSRLLSDMGLVLEHAELKHPLLVSRLAAEAERAKRQLTTAETTTIRIPNEAGEILPDANTVDVTRDDFRTWTDKILARVELPIRRALGDAKLARTDIDQVIMVGGATRMPLVIDHVRELFQQEPQRHMNPDEVIALGAAVQAGLIDRNESLDDLVVTDVAPFTLGVEIVRPIGGQDRAGYFLPVIHRNTTIPVSRVESVGTVSANQTEVKVRLFQGESRKVESNLLLGEFTVKGIPPGPAGQQIELRFTYDLNGVLQVEATVMKTSRKTTHVVTRHAGDMTEEQVAAAVRAMDELKIHPREDTANRYLLRRAERLFAELPMDQRQQLDEILSGFEAALEMQDPAAIESNREMLRRYLDALDPDATDDSDLDSEEPDEHS